MGQADAPAVPPAATTHSLRSADAQMKAGNNDIPEMVKIMYVGLEERLFPAACLSLLGHMGKLIDEGRTGLVEGARVRVLN